MWNNAFPFRALADHLQVLVGVTFALCVWRIIQFASHPLLPGPVICKTQQRLLFVCSSLACSDRRTWEINWIQSLKFILYCHFYLVAYFKEWYNYYSMTNKNSMVSEKCKILYFPCSFNLNYNFFFLLFSQINHQFQD